MLEWEFEGKRRKIKFLNPEIGAINIKDSIPLYISATGPRARSLVAELGTGWICPLGNPNLGVTAMEDMKKKWQAAGRDLKDLHVHGEIGGAVLKDGEAYDSDRIKDQAGPTAIMMVHDWVEAEELGTTGTRMPPPLAPYVERYRPIYEKFGPPDARYLSNHRGHLMFLKPEERGMCDTDMIRTFSWTGPKAELQRRIRILRDVGFHAISVQIRHNHPEMVDEWWEVFKGV
jgi:5,10-methylenetetrahydromethanopterin reductase